MEPLFLFGVRSCEAKKVPFSLIADGTIWISSVEEGMCSSVACVAAKVDPDSD